LQGRLAHFGAPGARRGVRGAQPDRPSRLDGGGLPVLGARFGGPKSVKVGLEGFSGIHPFGFRLLAHQQRRLRLTQAWHIRPRALEPGVFNHHPRLPTNEPGVFTHLPSTQRALILPQRTPPPFHLLEGGAPVAFPFPASGVEVVPTATGVEKLTDSLCTSGLRVRHEIRGDGTILGWKGNGKIFQETGGGLSSDSYLQGRFRLFGAVYNVPIKSCTLLGSRAPHNLHQLDGPRGWSVVAFHLAKLLQLRLQLSGTLVPGRQISDLGDRSRIFGELLLSLEAIVQVQVETRERERRVRVQRGGVELDPAVPFSPTLHVKRTYSSTIAITGLGWHGGHGLAGAGPIDFQNTRPGYH
jgi:hypothetical protein